MVRQTRKTKALNQLVERCCKKSPTGLVTNGHKGKVPAQ
jgi:hypothetical protein